MSNILKENSIKHRRLHPLWIVWQVIKSIREFILISMTLAFLFGLSSNPFVLKNAKIFVAIFFIYKFSSIILQWRHYVYYFDEREFFLSNGRFVQVKKYIPLERIQGFNQNTPFVYKLFGFTIVLLDTGATGKDSAIKLDMIKHTEAMRIKEHLKKYGSLTANENSNTLSLSKEDKEIKNSSFINSPNVDNEQKHYEIDSKEVFVGSLTSLRFIFFITLLYSTYSDIKQFFSIDKYIDHILSFFSSSWWALTLGIFILVGLSTTYGLLKTHLQYGDFKVTSNKKRIYIQKGKINKQEFSIPKNKIQAISIHYGLLQKWANIVKVRIISTSDNDDEEIKTSNVLFPFIHEDKAKYLIPKILPTFKIEEHMTPIPKRSIILKLMRSSYIWIISSLAVYYFFPDRWYIGIMVFSITITSQILNGLFSCYRIHNDYIQIKRVSLSTRLFITTRSRIEDFKVTETFLQRKLGLASIVIKSRANPVKNTVMADIPKATAIKYYQWYVEGFKNNEEYLKQTV